MAFAGVLKRVWIPDTVFSPKSVVYEDFGPVGTVADISCRPGTTTLVFADHGERFGRHG